MGILGDILGLPRPTSMWRGLNPLGIGLLSFLWWVLLLFPGANTLLCLCPLLGSVEIM
jgi:hypothetical protein